MMRQWLCGVVVFVALITCFPPSAFPDEPKPPAEPPKKEADVAAGDNAGLKQIVPDEQLWVDFKRKLVVVDGQVSLRQGQLELFACPKNTKEHESVVSVNAKARFIHAALLAIGVPLGQTVRFDPKYTPAKGVVVEIWVLWTDKDGKRHKVPAQQWVKHAKSGKAMSDNWIFGGSGFWKDEDTGKQYYHADTGDFICVSNFHTAMLDIPIESPQDDADRLFVAFTENIPPVGTKVRLVLMPRLPETKLLEKPAGTEAKGGTPKPAN